jgi:histone H4
MGVTKPDIRRLARRGGVKRISSTIYGEVRLNLRNYLQKLLQEVCAIVEMCKRKTVCTTDVVFALQRQGRTIYVSIVQSSHTMVWTLIHI